MINAINLLGRPEIQLIKEEVEPFINGKTILVTGAAGSIGSEIVRQLSHFSPKEIILFGHNESGMFFLEKELSLLFPNVKYNIQLGSICDLNRLIQVAHTYEPQIVYHAAANKHVPLSELNALEAYKTNVIGTKNVITATYPYVENFILISTDKAVNPSSVMGSTKLVAEMIVNNASYTSLDAKYNVVRFGNVLGSSGSVVPIFEKQILAGGPITVTHPVMERFFMTIPEASRLVIQASAFDDNGYSYVLKMGEQVKIVDIAKRMIKLLGYSENSIEIKYSGIRPGEKLSEELFNSHEKFEKTNHPEIMQTNFKFLDPNILSKFIDKKMEDDLQVRKELKSFIEKL